MNRPFKQHSIDKRIRLTLATDTLDCVDTDGLSNLTCAKLALVLRKSLIKLFEKPSTKFFVISKLYISSIATGLDNQQIANRYAGNKQLNNRLAYNKHWNKVISVGLIASLSVLTGCDDRVSASKDALIAIQNATVQPITPSPSPLEMEDYAYTANAVRSPFIPPSMLNRKQAPPKDLGITPDFSRPRTSLERYGLAELSYRGIMVDTNGHHFALVQRPDGMIERVSVGGYMGQNSGRVVAITPEQINLVEIVPDNSAGFIERSASLVSNS